jgi:hypothetical protein
MAGSGHFEQARGALPAPMHRDHPFRAPLAFDQRVPGQPGR